MPVFIRRTKTGQAPSGGVYYTYRLVSSVRDGDKVRQTTVLNLGADFALPKQDWSSLCSRIENILSGQLEFFQQTQHIESMAQRYAALIIAGKQKKHTHSNTLADPEFHDVDINSLELMRPRSVGVEHAGLEALRWLNFETILESVGMNSVQRAVALASILGRMAEPGSELRTWNWVRTQSALGELLNVDFENIPLMNFYRVSDILVRKREIIEKALFAKVVDLFSLPMSVTLFDLTNTYFEGELAGNAKAKRGRSKEKRSDCKLVTLAMVLDSSGFVKNSRMFEGNAAEAKTLEVMLSGMAAPQGAMIIMDRGIATANNIKWLVEHGYRYLVVNREQARSIDFSQAETITTSSGNDILVQREIDPATGDVFLRCHSKLRQEKEEAIVKRFKDKFEAGLAKIAEGLQKPRGRKKRDQIQQRIGRLKTQSRGIGQHYKITILPEEPDKDVQSLSWELKPIKGTMLTDPGVYCLRTNEHSWDAKALWKTYTMLTDLEAVFRSLKSELGLRPIYHHKEGRADGHLFITVLAYQAVQVLRRRLKAKDINESWSSLRHTLSVQQRVTVTFKRRDGRTLHVRKSTSPEPELANLYNILNLNSAPGGIKKKIH